MKIQGLVNEGVEVMGAVEPKMAKKKDSNGKWIETGEQTERDGLRAWNLSVLVQSGEDIRVREPLQVTVFAKTAPKVQDTHRIRFGGLDVKGYDNGKLVFTAHQPFVVRDKNWVESDQA